MRNLKKILALVLALVMSLSLMAVASADDELNLGDVSEIYAESVDVLTGLKVFQGNKGEFLPKTNITRAEVAAIIYRIVTGDVEDTQKSIYADYNKFSDVTSDAWYAGYVNYCANAEYVKGVGGGKFAPQQNVTGYEALAMILRAIGYDKNNEFTGSNWQIQTAATARNRGILKNIAEGTLGGAATREVVAEILCQTILVPMADYSLAFGYRTTDANGKDNENLAKKTFNMDKITGVVTANEYADLESATPVGAGQTTLKMADGEKRTMNVGSDLDDLGESRYVYVRPAAGTTRYDLVTSKVYDTGKNNVYDSYDEVATVGNSTGSEQGITSIVGATHLRNYAELIAVDAKSDWRIEYVIRMGISEYAAKTMFRDNGNANNSRLIDLKDDSTDTDDVTIPYSDVKDVAIGSTTENTWDRANRATSANPFTYEYRKVINVGETITSTDLTNIQTIFYKSAHLDAANPMNIGEVYVGTSTLEGVDDISDRSNRNGVSYSEFIEKYLKDKVDTITSNGLGNRLKIVDNDDNGVAEYVLQTVYTVAMVSGVDANGKISLDIANAIFNNVQDGCHSAHTIAPRQAHSVDNCNQITGSTSVKVYGDDEVATGNVVLYAYIDGTARIELAATETAKFDVVDRAAKTATVAGEGGATYNESAVHEHSAALTHTVQNLVTNTSYTLYLDKGGNLAAFTEGTNGGLVLITNGWYNVQKGGTEYAVRAWIDGSLQTVDVTGNGNLFIRGDATTQNNAWNQIRELTINSNDRSARVFTAVAQLQDGVLVPVDKAYYYSRQYRMLDMLNNTIPGRDNISVSRGVVYNTNYLNGVAYNVKAASARADESYDVRGLSSTTYYYVWRDNRNNTVVREYAGYASTPSIPANMIEDVYAVGTAATDASGSTYYTADVVVVELNAAYDQRSSEQVFVPGFYLANTSLTREQVEMIRGNGSVEKVLVDMSASQLRGYDPVDGNGVNGYQGNQGLGAGLYFLDESDTEKGLYILTEMTAQDIQRNNYAIGFVNKTYASAGEDWTSVDLYTWNQVRPQAGTAVVAPWTNGGATGIEVAKRHTDASKYYSLKYDSYNNATLAEVADRYDALRQNPADPAVDDQLTNPEMLNETLRAAHPQRNEVLVRYDAAGNIIYSVSFNEYRTGLQRDFAQTVWYRNMPSSYAQVSGSEPTVKFYGGLENDTTATYGEAKAHGDAGAIVITKGNGDGAVDGAISSVTVTTIVTGVTTAPQTKVYTSASPEYNVYDGTYTIPGTLNAAGVRYEISVVYPQANGTNVNKTFILNQSALVNAGVLALKTGSTTGLSLTSQTIAITASSDAEKLPVKAFINQFRVENGTGTLLPNSYVVWTLKTYDAIGGKTYTLKANADGSLTAEGEAELVKIVKDDVSAISMVKSIKAVVYNENDVQVGSAYTNGVAADTEDLATDKQSAKTALTNLLDALSAGDPAKKELIENDKATQKKIADIEAAIDAVTNKDLIDATWIANNVTTPMNTYLTSRVALLKTLDDVAAKVSGDAEAQQAFTAARAAVLAAPATEEAAIASMISYMSANAQSKMTASLAKSFFNAVATTASTTATEEEKDAAEKAVVNDLANVTASASVNGNFKDRYTAHGVSVAADDATKTVTITVKKATFDQYLTDHSSKPDATIGHSGSITNGHVYVGINFAIPAGAQSAVTKNGDRPVASANGGTPVVGQIAIPANGIDWWPEQGLMCEWFTFATSSDGTEDGTWAPLASEKTYNIQFYSGLDPKLGEEVGEMQSWKVNVVVDNTPAPVA